MAITIKAPMAPMTARTQAITASNIKPEAKNVADLVEKMRADEQFLFGISIIKFFCTTVPVTIDAESDEPHIEALRANLESVWYQKQKAMLDAIEYGRVAFEKVYAYDYKDRIYKLDQLNELDYKLSEMVLDKEGQFIGIKYSTINLPFEASWWLAMNTKATEPHGRSIYLGAPYSVWKMRRQHDRNTEIWLKRFAIGRGVGFAPSEFPPGMSDAGQNGEVAQDGSLRNPMIEMKKALQTTESGGDIIFPSERDPVTNQPLYSYAPAQDLKDGAALISNQQMLDNKALRSLVIPDRAVTQDAATGARAVADTHLRVFYSIIEGIVADEVESFQKGVIEPACEINGFDDDVITANYQSLGDGAKDLIKSIIQTIVTGSAINPIVAQGLVDVPAMLKTAGIPLGPNIDEAIAAIKASVAPAPAPAAPAPGGFGSFPRSFSFLEEVVDGNRRRRKMLRELSTNANGDSTVGG